MKIIVADSLPASALEVLDADGWTVDARSGRSPKELAADLADDRWAAFSSEAPRKLTQV
jgi:hypothetical protein